MPLADIIRAEIAAHGPMPLPRYMELCLTHPEYGYYTTRDPLGVPTEKGGDFTTSPEITQMFGELLGIWAIHEWQQLGEPAPFTLLELGPGRGTLMEDLLRAARQAAPGFVAAAQLHLCDASPVLRQMQQEKLGPYNPRWIDDLAQLPAQPTIVIANEFFDALPIVQVRRDGDAWVQKTVTLDSDKLVFATLPAHDVPQDITTANIDGWAEYSPASRTIMHTLSAHLAAHRGAAAIVDYGYTSLLNVRNCDTLQALHRHQPVDPLADPGTADLTAHVDFAALENIARAGGVDNVRQMTQGDFLRMLGIEHRAARLNQPNELARLTAPGQMGDLFKVLDVYVR